MQLNPDEYWSVATLGHQLLEQGRLDEARALFEGLTLTNPTEHYPWFGLACIARQSSQKDASIGLFTHALKLGADSTARLRLAETLLELRRLPEAQQHLALLQKDPDESIRAKATLLSRAIRR